MVSADDDAGSEVVSNKHPFVLPRGATFGSVRPMQGPRREYIEAADPLLFRRLYRRARTSNLYFNLMAPDFCTVAGHDQEVVFEGPLAQASEYLDREYPAGSRA